MRRGLLALAVAGTALITAVSAFAAGNAGSTMRTSFDPTGAQFTCTNDAVYTITGGTINQVMHFSLDATGQGHVTGTITPVGVSATDGTSTYRIVGADWFGATGTDENNPFVATDTGHFVILSSSGGVVGKVQYVDHISPNGTSFSFDRGNCEEPQD
jgi:hypothetical protein